MNTCVCGLQSTLTLLKEFSTAWCSKLISVGSYKPCIALEGDNVKVKVSCFCASSSFVQHWIKPRSWRWAMGTWWSGWRRWRPTGALCCPSNSLRATGTTSARNRNHAAAALCPAARDASCHRPVRPGHPNTCSVPPAGLSPQILLRYIHRRSWSKQLCPLHAQLCGHSKYSAWEAHGILHPEGTAAISCHLKWRSKRNTLTGILCLAENFKTNTVSLGLFSWQYL